MNDALFHGCSVEHSTFQKPGAQAWVGGPRVGHQGFGQQVFSRAPDNAIIANPVFSGNTEHITGLNLVLEFSREPSGNQKTQIINILQKIGNVTLQPYNGASCYATISDLDIAPGEAQNQYISKVAAVLNELEKTLTIHPHFQGFDTAAYRREDSMRMVESPFRKEALGKTTFVPPKLDLSKAELTFKFFGLPYILPTDEQVRIIRQYIREQKVPDDAVTESREYEDATNTGFIKITVDLGGNRTAQIERCNQLADAINLITAEMPPQIPGKQIVIDR